MYSSVLGGMSLYTTYVDSVTHVSPQKKRSDHVDTPGKAVENMGRGPCTSVCTCSLPWHLPPLCPCTSDDLLLCLIFIGNKCSRSTAPPFLPLPPNSCLSPQSTACRFLAARSCFLCDRAGRCLRWSLLCLLICVKHFFRGRNISLSFFPFHIKRYGIWAFGGVGRESGLFGDGFRCSLAFNCISFTWVAGLL